MANLCHKVLSLKQHHKRSYIIFFVVEANYRRFNLYEAVSNKMQYKNISTSTDSHQDNLKSTAEFIVAFYQNFTTEKSFRQEFPPPPLPPPGFSGIVIYRSIFRQQNNSYLFHIVFEHLYSFVQLSIYDSQILNPTRTKESEMISGRFTSIPSVANNASCSSSLMVGNLSFKDMDLYKRPLVLKNFFNGRPLCLYQRVSSSFVGFCSLMWRAVQET